MRRSRRFGRCRVLDAPGIVPPEAPHGQLPHPGVRALRATRRAILGVVLAES